MKSVESITSKPKITQLRCLRCKHRWYPQKPKLPKVCPKCKSPYWNKPKGWWKKHKKYLSEDEVDKYFEDEAKTRV